MLVSKPCNCMQVLELNADRANGKKGGQGALRKLMEAACAERDRSAAKQAQLQVRLPPHGLHILILFDYLV